MNPRDTHPSLRDQINRWAHPSSSIDRESFAVSWNRRAEPFFHSCPVLQNLQAARGACNKDLHFSRNSVQSFEARQSYYLQLFYNTEWDQLEPLTTGLNGTSWIVGQNGTWVGGSNGTLVFGRSGEVRLFCYLYKVTYSSVPPVGHLTPIYKKDIIYRSTRKSWPPLSTIEHEPTDGSLTCLGQLWKWKFRQWIR